MANVRALSATGFVVLLFVAELRADDSKPYEAPSSPADAVSKADAAAKPGRSKYELIQPRLGRGYVPYSYPAFDSCRCASDGCFPPGWYYCGGKEYRKQWFRKWLRAHLGGGSMLDGYPCHCISPTAGRPYLKPVSSADAASQAPVPPVPGSLSLPPQK